MEEEESPGVPEWVVTYGDMMSLLLTFFIMLVSLSEIVEIEKYRAILEAIRRYSGYQLAPSSPPGDSFPLNSLVQQLDSLGSPTNIEKGHGGVKTESLTGPDVRVFRTREGTPLPVGEPIVFPPHQATLSPSTQAELKEIATSLAGKPNKVEIRAHASRQPLPRDSTYRDKTELTYERGRAILEFLIQEGINPKRLRVCAAADTQTPSFFSEQRPLLSQDRAEILMLDAFVDEFVGPREAPD